MRLRPFLFPRWHALLHVPPPPMALLGTYSEGGLIYSSADLFICLFGPFCKADFPQENGGNWVTQAKPPSHYQEKIRLLQRLKRALCLCITADLTHKNDSLKVLLWHPELLIVAGYKSRWCILFSSSSLIPPRTARKCIFTLLILHCLRRCEKMVDLNLN